MSNINSIFRLIYGETQEEIKLSKEVTLGSQKEIKGLFAKGNQKFSEAQQKKNSVIKALEDLISMHREAAMEYIKALESYNELKSQADKLGLEMPEDLNGIRKQIGKNNDTITEVIKGVQAARGTIK